jgi:DNA polymerase III epsilon subunit-like protein
MRGAVVVGHNVRFDLGFLHKEIRRSGQDILQAIGDVPVLDTVRIARRRFGRGGNGLQALAPRLGVFPTVAHRALADVLTTVGVFEKLLEPLGGWNLPLCDALLAQGGKMGLLPANPRESLLPLELEEALEMRKPVMLEYLDAREARTQRIIQPLHVRRVKGELMLVAHCQMRGAQRTFKLERIVQLTRIDADQPAASTAPAPTTGSRTPAVEISLPPTLFNVPNDAPCPGNPLPSGGQEQ